MKFNTLAALLPSKVEEAEEVSTGEHAVNFSTDLEELELGEKVHNQCKQIGISAIKSGYHYKGKLGRTLSFQAKGSEEEINVTMFPYTAELRFEVVNDGEQMFRWNQVQMSEFIELADGDMDRLKHELTALMDALENAQRFVGTAPEYHN